MAIPLLPPGKYQLRSLHEEIALFDRKLAHMKDYESFSSEKERETALEKLTARRSLLARKAQELIDNGVEVTYAPRPSAPQPVSVKAVSPTEPANAQPEGSAEEMALMGVPSPFAGTSLDFRAEVEAYKANRSRRKPA